MDLQYTSGARKTLGFTKAEALRLGHVYLAPEHLLLGLLDNNESDLAIRALLSLDVNLQELKSDVETRARNRCLSENSFSLMDVMELFSNGRKLGNGFYVEPGIETLDYMGVIRTARYYARENGGIWLGNEDFLLGLNHSGFEDRCGTIPYQCFAKRKINYDNLKAVLDEIKYE